MLNIALYSFSYKKGIPEDTSGNGGGYVFDCRGILNPGRQEVYKTKTGRDKTVMDFLENETNINTFLDAVFSVISVSIDNYIERDFENLQVSFGCTGGQHRSVYSADALEKWLKKKYAGKIKVTLVHREQEAKNWINE